MANKQNADKYYSPDEIRGLLDSDHFLSIVNRVIVLMERFHPGNADNEDAVQDAIKKMLEGTRRLPKPTKKPIQDLDLVYPLLLMSRSVLNGDRKKRRVSDMVSYDSTEHKIRTNVLFLPASMTNFLSILDDDKKRKLARMLWDKRRDLGVNQIIEELGISLRSYYKLRRAVYEDVQTYIQRFLP